MNIEQIAPSSINAPSPPKIPKGETIEGISFSDSLENALSVDDTNKEKTITTDNAELAAATLAAVLLQSSTQLPLIKDLGQIGSNITMTNYLPTDSSNLLTANPNQVVESGNTKLIPILSEQPLMTPAGGDKSVVQPTNQILLDVGPRPSTTQQTTPTTPITPQVNPDVSMGKEVALTPNVVETEATPKIINPNQTGEQPVIKDASQQSINLAANEGAIINAYKMAAPINDHAVVLRNTDMVKQVSQNISEMVKTGQTSMHLQLYPENLGRIDLHMVSSADGGMQVTMKAALPSTSQLLESRLDQLHQSLTSAGIALSGLTVSHQGANSNPQGTFQWGNGRNKSISPIISEENIISLVESNHNTLAGLDYRV